ncbi:RTA1 like protein-domain-containing protein [Hypoxylon trugodes]|uniref:RTA1 like protein-domain-containing protein n=1 Tax=Hypoxylon trugodes TaxID=326681 RepID=UPI00219180EF|nr:RTA1 like protein-domain-containing protein [Hypoxylon trugodes]KAI1394132.1 RTA1 like protein-domain-containing protein [Hypoxylon trugodes]
MSIFFSKGHPASLVTFTMRSIASCDFDTCPVAASPYGYPPSPAAEAIFLTIHIGALLACQLYTFYIADRNRWLEFSVPISIACLLESIGYAIRIGSSVDPWNVVLYATSTAFIIVAPAFIATGIYFITPEVIKILGKEHSPINIAHYPLLIWVDIVGFALQLIGIIVSFSDISTSTGLGHNAHYGTPIIATGIILQAVSLITFLSLFTIVLFQASLTNSHYGYTTFHPSHGFVPIAQRFKFFVAMLLVSTMCLFGRGVYQVIILSEGLESWTAKNQALFAGLDSFLVAEAVVGLVIAHPVLFLRDGLDKRLLRRNSNNPLIEERGMSRLVVGSTPCSSTTNFVQG